MEEKILNKNQITDDLNQQLGSATRLCGVDIELLSATSISTSIYSSSAIRKIEKMAGYDGHYIEKLMEKEFGEATRKVSFEVAKIYKKALDNVLEGTLKDLSNILSKVVD